MLDDVRISEAFGSENEDSEETTAFAGCSGISPPGNRSKDGRDSVTGEEAAEEVRLAISFPVRLGAGIMMFLLMASGLGMVGAEGVAARRAENEEINVPTVQ